MKNLTRESRTQQFPININCSLLRYGIPIILQKNNNSKRNQGNKNTY